MNLALINDIDQLSLVFLSQFPVSSWSFVKSENRTHYAQVFLKKDTIVEFLNPKAITLLSSNVDLSLEDFYFTYIKNGMILDDPLNAFAFKHLECPSGNLFIIGCINCLNVRFLITLDQYDTLSIHPFGEYSHHCTPLEWKETFGQVHSFEVLVEISKDEEDEYSQVFLEIFKQFFSQELD